MVTEKFVAVIVLYNLLFEESMSLFSLNQCCADLNDKFDVIIYDNSPEQNPYDLTHYKWLNVIEYKWDKKNSGVSAAYNYAAEFSKKLNKEYLIVLDQDSNLSLNYLDEAIRQTGSNPSINLFAPILKYNDKIYSPCKYLYYKAWHFNDVSLGIRKLKHETLLNSGLIIKLSFFNQIGGFNPMVKLYFSDFEFINRARKYTSNYYCLNSICMHDLGSTEQINKPVALSRFRYYCNGAIMSIKSENVIEYLWVTFFIFLRSVKLSIQFKDIAFLNTFFKYYMTYNKSNRELWNQ